MIVRWSITAETSLQEELDFIHIKWGERQVQDFLNLIDKHVEILKTGILLGTALPEYNAYKWVISKQTSLIYSLEEDVVYILLLWNNKRKPKSFFRYLQR